MLFTVMSQYTYTAYIYVLLTTIQKVVSSIKKFKKSLILTKAAVYSKKQ